MLQEHTNVGVDFDETLIEGEYSLLLQRHIADNYKTKNFWIVTFRSHGMEKTDVLVQDLAKGSRSKEKPNGLIRLNMFKGIASIPYSLYEKAYKTRAFHEPNLPKNQWEPEFLHYTMWKGKTCKDLGLTCLIDDRPREVKPGCRYYGIEFVDAIDLPKHLPQKILGSANRLLIQLSLGDILCSMD